MQTLRSVLASFALRTQARMWVGKTPTASDANRTAWAIAQQVGLPATASNPFADDGMAGLSRAQAAHVLAVAGTTSLAYDRPDPSDDAIHLAGQALADLSAGAVFLSNGLWVPGASASWTPLTAATFDCGIIGFDATHGFIFWVEEED